MTQQTSKTVAETTVTSPIVAGPFDIEEPVALLWDKFRTYSHDEFIEFISAPTNQRTDLKNWFAFIATCVQFIAEMHSDPTSATTGKRPRLDNTLVIMRTPAHHGWD